MLKYTFKFMEINRRLETRKNRSKTIMLPKEYFETYNVTAMIKAFRYNSKNFTFHDSDLILKSIKVNNREFVL